MAANSSDSSSFDPSVLTPLFTAQSITCAYPISDLYASSPRYLYYALLLATLVTQWYPWLANVFLGAAATYAGTAAIEALILISNPSQSAPRGNITLPYVFSASVKGNQTLGQLENLITNTSLLPFQPAALELDIDGILAIVVTGYLMMLPIHCWSQVIRAHRIRHILMGMWNLLMLAGTICGLILWNQISDFPIQFRFCYPQFPDSDSVTSDGAPLPANIWQGDWNSTIWHTFGNVERAFSLANNCMYPCFNTSQIMRRANSLTASVSAASKSPRTNLWISDRSLHRILALSSLIYIAIGISGVTAILLLIITSTKLRRITRVPVHRPRQLLQHHHRKELCQTLWTELKLATRKTKTVPIPSSRHTRDPPLHSSSNTLEQHLALHSLVHRRHRPPPPRHRHDPHPRDDRSLHNLDRVVHPRRPGQLGTPLAGRPVDRRGQHRAGAGQCGDTAIQVSGCDVRGGEDGD